MRAKKLTAQLTIRLDDELLAALAATAAADGRSTSNYVVRVLQAHLESLKAKKPKTKS